MEEKEVVNKVNEVFQELFEDDELMVNRETTTEDIEEWDSLMHLQLISNVEDKLGVQFSLGEISNFKNVGELYDSTIKHTKE